MTSGRTVKLSYTLSQKIIKSHLVSGDMKPGNEIGLKIDQTLSNMLNGQKVSETLVGIFKMIGMDLISCDNNVTQNERNDINIYISNLEKYVQNELGTINNNNFVKSTAPNNTLKSNYEFLKKN